MTRTARPLAALALVVLLAVGCSKATTHTFAASTDSTAASGSSNSSVAADERAVKFSACMRDHGVKGFPDPDASGQLTIDAIANGSSVDPSTAVFTQALTACKDLEPAGFTGAKRTAQQQEAALEFAQCVRDNGVKDFPDPTPDSPLIDTNRIPSTATNAGMSALNAALSTCGDFAAAAGVTGGR